MEDDIILVDKPAGISSFGVVAKVRGFLKAKFKHKVKVGHTGTLDPFATGLLILMSGKMTKRADEFLKLDKVYEATIELGATSTTGDLEGEIQPFLKETASFSQDISSASSQKGLETKNPPERAKVETIVQSFKGKSTQRVPKFSAVKINGERAYKLARKGEDFEPPTREIEIYEIEILDYHFPELKIRAHVSSGTYIRTLGEDIGEKLGVGGYLTALRRLKIGRYDIKDAKPLSDFTG